MQPFVAKVGTNSRRQIDFAVARRVLATVFLKIDLFSRRLAVEIS